MNRIQYNISDKIVNYGFSFIAAISLPLNVIIYFAISNSQSIIIKILPPLLSFFVILLYIYRKKLSFRTRTSVFSLLLFLAGIYTLILGLLDMASLWFILSIIFASFDSKKQIAFIIFVVALFFTIATGLLMIFKNPYLPIDYGFDNCQFACVTIRIINFLIIGFLIFKILNMFFSTLNLYIKEINDKNIVLEQLKITEKNEAEQKLKNQELKNNSEKQELELKYKGKELATAFSKILQFNTLLENIKKEISNKNFHEALVNVTANQSKNYCFDSFVVKFNELYPHFTLKLKESYPQLSETDVHLCILISAGLKSIEIAELLNVKESTVGTYRNRLRKKFGLENNADISDFLLEKIKNL